MQVAGRWKSSQSGLFVRSRLNESVSPSLRFPPLAGGVRGVDGGYEGRGQAEVESDAGVLCKSGSRTVGRA